MRSFARLFLLVCPGLVALGLSAQPASGPLHLGTAWYPEHWPEERWPEDLRLMQAANIRVVRLAEYSWSSLEPSEGRYDLDWVERAVSLAARYGIACVLGTGTAAPPEWMAQKYPEVVRTLEDGRRDERKPNHYRFTSRRYREYCRRLAEAMAKRFGHNPNVIGWQIDNEYGEDSWDEDTRAQFQEWLKKKFGSLDEINRRWTTKDFSQTYTDWGQIPLGRRETLPGVAFAFRRFVTDGFREYQALQVEVLRKHIGPRQFLTINSCCGARIDLYETARELDFSSSDEYPSTGHIEPLGSGLTFDLIRGLKRKNFWQMEAQPGHTDWSEVNNALDRGEVRTMVWNAVGHGADAVLFWHWRTPLGGHEQYFGMLVGVDGTPLPLYEEAAEIGREFAKAAPALDGTTPVSEAALLHDFASRWAIENHKQHSLFDPLKAMASFYRPLRTEIQSVDVISPEAPLNGYKLVIAPALNVISQAVAERLTAYVKQGGHLVLGPRSGMIDDLGILHPERQPGPLAGALGGRVEQFYALEEAVPVSGRLGECKAIIWAERLQPRAPDVEVLLRYGAANGWLDGQPAALTRTLGKGRITYLGAWLDEASMEAAVSWMIRSAGVRPAFGAAPRQVEVCRREAPGKRVFLLINHSREPQSVELPRRFQSVLADRTVSGRLNLPPRGVEVLLEEIVR